MIDLLVVSKKNSYHEICYLTMEKIHMYILYKYKALIILSLGFTHHWEFPAYLFVSSKNKSTHKYKSTYFLISCKSW